MLALKKSREREVEEQKSTWRRSCEGVKQKLKIRC